MRLLQNKLYIETVKKVANQDIDWAKFKNKTFLVTGATGMIGSFLIDVLMFRNEKYDAKHSIIAIGRNENKARERFEEYYENNFFSFVKHDVNEMLDLDSDCDYIFHLASNTHPIAYSTDPIGTIESNLIGTHKLLSLACMKKCSRFVFASSVEIYGENRGDVEKFDEKYCGYIDCNTLRAGYPESKRAGESLCQAFIKQKGLDIIIPRLSRVYGPTMLASDTKAISQFIKKGVNNEDVILKSEGTQLYSYSYVADAVSALLHLLYKGKCGEAYNIADESSDIMLKDLASIIASCNERNVIFELPDELESAGYSTATTALLDASKIKELGWKPMFNMKTGLKNTIEILRIVKE